MPDALDYSFSRPTSPAALAAQGIKLVSRYLSPPPNGKNLSAAEAAALHAAGIGVLLNWESSAARPLGGAANGDTDARQAANLAENIGAPHGLTIYYSCDTDTSPVQWPTIAAYYRAARDATAGRYLVGMYGEADLVDYLHRDGAVTSEWQTYAWSGGRLSAETDLYQYLNGQQMAGASVDFNRIIHADKLGAWWPNGAAPLGSGSLINGTEDPLMPLADADATRLVQRVDALFTALNPLDVPALNAVSSTMGDTRTRIGLIQSQLDNARQVASDQGQAIVAIAQHLGAVAGTATDPALASKLAAIVTKLDALASKSYTITGSAA